MTIYSLFYLLFVQVSLLVPGYVLMKKYKFLAKNPGIQLCLSYCTTIVFFAALATADYAFRLRPVISRIFCWLIIVGSIYLFVHKKYFKDLWKLRFPLICLLAMSVFSTAFVGLTFKSAYAIVPDPAPIPGSHYNTLNVKVLNIAQTQANDNYVPYRQAQFFINRSNPAKDSFIGEWGVDFFERTPLMGAVTANYFNLLHDQPPINFTWSSTAQDPAHTYLKFQIIASVLNALFIVPAFFILTKLFNKKTAILACLFFVSSQFFLYNSVFSWPKSFVAFFILLSWMLLFEKKMKYTVLAGAVSGIAYLTHDLAVLYIGASVVYLLCNKRFKETLAFVLTAFAFALPWLFTADVIYHEPSSFVYYPISVGGIPQPSQSKLIIHQFLHTSPLRLIYIRVENFVYLMSPYELLTSEGGQTLFRRLWAFGLYSMPGSLGIGLVIPTVLQAIKKIRDVNFWILAIVPILMANLIIGWPKGLGALHFAEGVTVLLSGLGIFYLARLKNIKWLLAAFVANCVQLIFFVSYSFKFAVGNWFTNPTDIVRLLAMAAIVAFCGWAIYKIATGKKIWIAA